MYSWARSPVRIDPAVSAARWAGRPRGIRVREVSVIATPDPAAGGEPPAESEPDARFTFANERTFLAWTRTALAFMVAGLAIVQLLPPFPGVPWGRHVLGVPLIAIGAVIAVVSYAQWVGSQRALRRGEPLPGSVLPKILAASIAIMAVVAAVVLLVSAIVKP